MKQNLTSLSLTIAALVASVPLARAAGPFDGSWSVDAPESLSSTGGGEGGCEAVRLPFKIVDNKIVGSLEREPYGIGGVEAGTDKRATPLTGTVNSDGTVTARWQSYQVTGKISGDKIEVRWTGPCGPRVAKGGRVKEVKE